MCIRDSRVFTPGYFAREDTRTPVKIAALAMIVNVVLNLVLMQRFGHVGIALASSVSAWLNVFLLIVVLARRGHFMADARLMSRLAGIVGASVIMAGALWFAAAWAVPWLAGPIAEQVAALSALVIGGFVLYLIAARVFGVYSIAEIRGMLRRAR